MTGKTGRDGIRQAYRGPEDFPIHLPEGAYLLSNVGWRKHNVESCLRFILRDGSSRFGINSTSFAFYLTSLCVYENPNFIQKYILDKRHKN